MTRSTLLPRLRTTLAAAALCATAVAAQASVLILGSPGSAGGLADVQSKIAATGVVGGTIDVFNAHTGTPTLAMLTGYDAVLVYLDVGAPDTKFADAKLLGNVLADYVDAGGGVVEAGLSNATTAFGGLDGRFVSGNYDVFNANNQQGSCSGPAKIAVADSPLIRDIDSFSSGLSSLCYKLTPKTGAQVVAYWNNDRALLGYRTDHNGIVASVNLWPVSGDVESGPWGTSTAGALLTANALAFAAGELPEPGSLALLGIAAVAAGVAGRRRARAVTAAAPATTVVTA
jgi:hypothetical protein